jgi:hypothetical protein
MEDLHRAGLQATGWFFCNGDKDWRIRFTNEIAFFSFPFEFVPASFLMSGKTVRGGAGRLLFPLEGPPKRERTSVFELDNGSGIVQFQALKLGCTARGCCCYQQGF